MGKSVPNAKQQSERTRRNELDAKFGHLATQALRTALDLGVFHRLAVKPMASQALARATKANHRALGMVLNALVGLGELERSNDQYSLPAQVRKCLACPGVDPQKHFDAMLSHLRQLQADWSRLTEVVRTAKPVTDLGDAGKAEDVFPALVRYLFPGNYLTSKAVYSRLPERLRTGEVRVLDAAAGAAPWSIPFAEANPQARVDAVDFPGVLEVARHFARSCGVEAQFSFVPGDIHDLDFGRGRYDLAILGHICHSEGAARSKKLFKKVAKALKPGGVMYVVEWIVDEDRRGEGTGAFPLLFALNMLVHSEEGDTFAVSEYRAWAEAAGFARLDLLECPGPGPILLFHKEG